MFAARALNKSHSHRVNPFQEAELLVFAPLTADLDGQAHPPGRLHLINSESGQAGQDNANGNSLTYYIVRRGLPVVPGPTAPWASRERAGTFFTGGANILVIIPWTQVMGFYRFFIELDSVWLNGPRLYGYFGHPCLSSLDFLRPPANRGHRSHLSWLEGTP